MKVLSLGWGVQSFTIACMAALGEIDKVDYAIHSDTTFESKYTYEIAEKMTVWLEERGVKVITVHPNKYQLETFSAGKSVSIPAFTLNITGEKGQLRRQCTSNWKIQPIRRMVQKLRKGEHVNLLLGITTDESTRVRDSNVKYITNKYPLIDMGYSRQDCISWLENRGIEVPHKSACYFCPFRDFNSWRETKETTDWDKALEVDRKLRNKRNGFNVYVHPARIQLDKIDFRTPQEQGQLDMWDEECSGICGV